MQFRKKQLCPLVASLAAVGIGYVISNPLVFGFCSRIYKFNDYYGCLDDIIKNIGNPLLTFSVWVLLLSLVAIFLREATFKSWLRLTTWMLPVIIILLAFAPTDSHSWMPIYFISRDDFAKYFGILFAIISLILIGWKTFFAKAKS